MSGTVKKDVSLKNRVLAGLVVGGLLLAASGPTQAADRPDGISDTTGAIVLGRKPSIIKREDAPTALGRKPGIAGKDSTIALGRKPGIIKRAGSTVALGAKPEVSAGSNRSV